MREILLIETSGRQYGIWKDEIQAVREAVSLHRLPLSPACIAGVAIIDGSTVTLADLPVCIGLASEEENGKRRVLLLSSGDGTTGFIVSGSVDSCSVPPEDVLPLPEYLRTDLIPSCFVYAGVLVPIVNLAAVYRQLLKTDQESSRASFSVTGPAGRTAAEIRVFRIGTELFGALSEGGQESPEPAGSITELSLVPQFVRGITLRRGTVLPVIDLGQRIRRQKIEGRGQMMVQATGSAAFGLLVEEFLGSSSHAAALILDLPEIARNSWLRSAMVQQGTIIPLVDIRSLLTVDGHAAEEKLLQRYALADRFHSLFNRQTVEVVEFCLLGARHALPKSEVEDVIPLAPFRPIPDTTEIVIGVMEHKGSLLPVLDLAMVFGRRSLFNPGWKMVLIGNGDFRAFVITEAVYPERSLPLDVQRTLPIVLPHRVVYGCYPDSEGVRLILNVGAIALHFEKSLVQELLPALSPEMKRAPAGFVASLLGEEAATALAAEAAVTAQDRDEVPAATAPDDGSRASVAVGAAAAYVTDGGKQDLKQEDGKTVPAAAAVESGEPREQPGPLMTDTMPAPVASDWDRKDNVQAGEPSLVPELTAPAAEGTAAEAVLKPDRETLEEAGQEHALPAQMTEEAGAEEKSGEATPSPMPVIPADPESEPVSAQKAEATAVVEEQNDLAEPVTQEREPEREPLPAQESVPEREAGSKTRSTDAAASVVDPGQVPEAKTASLYQVDQGTEPEPRLRYPSQGSTGKDHAEREPGAFSQFQQEPQPVRSRLSPESQAGPEASRRKRGIAYAAIAVLAAVILFLLQPFEPGRNGKPGETVPGKAGQTGTKQATATSEAAKPKQASVQAKVETQAPQPEPPLYLEVPREKPLEIDIYVVVKDDTLWSISERFTGNPFNYPRIAGENRIADPDLIFPGQRIRLKKK